MARAKKATTEPAALELVTVSADETQAFGEQLGRLLRAGDVIALQGELGTGKTTLVQGIAHGAGVTGVSVKSPTFVLVREYPGPVQVIHIDAYRLEGAPSAAWLDVDLLLGPEKITLIEWAERVDAILPPDHVTLKLEHASANRRRISVMGNGVRATKIIEQLKQASVHSPQSMDHGPSTEDQSDVAGG